MATSLDRINLFVQNFIFFIFSIISFSHHHFPGNYPTTCCTHICICWQRKLLKGRILRVANGCCWSVRSWALLKIHSGSFWPVFPRKTFNAPNTYIHYTRSIRRMPRDIPGTDACYVRCSHQWQWNVFRSSHQSSSIGVGCRFSLFFNKHALSIVFIASQFRSYSRFSNRFSLVRQLAEFIFGVAFDGENTFSSYLLICRNENNFINFMEHSIRWFWC